MLNQSELIRFDSSQGYAPMPDYDGVRVCPDCFGNRGLQFRIERIRPDFDDENCSFHPTKKGVPIEEVAKIVDKVFRDNYAGAEPDGYGTETGSTLDELLYELTDGKVDEAVAALKAELIEQDEFWPPDGDEAFYSDEYDYHKLQDTDSYGTLWRDFHQHLKHEQRFFSRKAFDLIKEIFEGVEKQRDRIKRSPIYMIKPGKRNAFWYRARVASDHGEVGRFLKALEKELGPPPERLRKPGRLNPAGVATFYGAFDLDTCIAELRPAVGCLVATAKFAITEPLCVLDTTRFAEQPRSSQIFRRDEAKRRTQWNFMQGFSQEISKPISPGNEYLDYIPTQAVAEYLSNHHTVQIEGETRNIDAIIYASAQRRGGRNIAILGGAGVVGHSPGKHRSRPKSDEEDIFGFLWTGRQRTRLTPIAKSFECHEIEGANFDRRNYKGSFGRTELFDPDEAFPD